MDEQTNKKCIWKNSKYKIKFHIKSSEMHLNETPPIDRNAHNTSTHKPTIHTYDAILRWILRTNDFNGFKNYNFPQFTYIYVKCLIKLIEKSPCTFSLALHKEHPMTIKHDYSKWKGFQQETACTHIQQQQQTRRNEKKKWKKQWRKQNGEKKLKKLLAFAVIWSTKAIHLAGNWAWQFLIFQFSYCCLFAHNELK